MRSNREQWFRAWTPVLDSAFEPSLHHNSSMTCLASYLDSSCLSCLIGKMGLVPVFRTVGRIHMSAQNSAQHLIAVCVSSYQQNYSECYSDSWPHSKLLGYSRWLGGSSCFSGELRKNRTFKPSINLVDRARYYPEQFFSSSGMVRWTWYPSTFVPSLSAASRAPLVHTT